MCSSSTEQTIWRKACWMWEMWKKLNTTWVRNISKCPKGLLYPSKFVMWAAMQAKANKSHLVIWKKKKKDLQKGLLLISFWLYLLDWIPLFLHSKKWKHPPTLITSISTKMCLYKKDRLSVCFRTVCWSTAVQRRWHQKWRISMSIH